MQTQGDESIQYVDQIGGGDGELQFDLASGKQAGSDVSSVDLKFKGTSMIMNVLLFMLLLVICAFFILVVLACITFVMRHCCNCMRCLCQIVKNKLMYNSVIRGLLEAYFLMSIAAIYQVHNTQEFDTEGKFNFSISILTLVYLVAFPIWSLWYLLKNRSRLDKPEMYLKYGTLY